MISRNDVIFRSDNDKANALARNIPLRGHLSLYYGGMYGDWKKQGLIPPVPPSRLRHMTVGEWLEWKRNER